MADIKFLISVDEKNARATIEAFGGSLKNLGITAKEQTSPALGGLWLKFAAGQLAADALKKGIGFLVGELKSTVGAAIESETKTRALESALATTGRTVDAMLPGLISFAGEIQNQTTQTDEAALSAMALLTQLTDLDEQGIKKATEGAAGMATVFGIDLEGAAQNVAKAMEGNYTMMGRYIPKLKEAKTEGQKHAIVMETLAQWYGRAKSETDTFGGSLKQLKNSWDEVKETVGGAIIQNESLKGGLQKLKEWVDKIAQSEDFKLWLSIVIDGIMKAAELAGKFAGALLSVGDALAGLKGKNKEFEDSQIKLNEALERARAAGHDLGNKVIPTIKTEIEKVTPAIEKTSDRALGFTKVMQTQSAVLADAGENLFYFLGGLKDAPFYFNAVLPPARDMTEVLEKATGVIYDMPWSDVSKRAKKATTETKGYFDGLYNDIAKGFGDMISKWMSGALTFRDFMKGIWDDIKQAFFRMIGEMVADAVLGLFKSFFTSIKDTATSAIGDVGKALAGAASGWATGIGAAVGSFLGTVLAGIISGAPSGHAQQQMINDMKDARNFLAEIRNWFFSAGTGFGGASYDFITGHVGEWLTSIKISTDLTRDQMIPRLDRIVEYTALLKKIKWGQGGVDTITRGPTLFGAGEHRPERVMISPNINIGTSSAPIIMDGRAVARVVFKYLPEMSRDGYAKIHQRGIINN